MFKDKPINEVLRGVAIKNKVSSKEVEEIIDSMYKFIYNTTPTLKLKSKSLEEIENTKKNFNIPGIGKLYFNIKRFTKIINIKNEREKDI